MIANRLRTDDLVNPIGLGNTTPVFSWNCMGGEKQTAYRIAATCRGDIVWDSGKVHSDSMRVAYAGRSLVSRQRVEWSVTLWGGADMPGAEAAAFFELGLLQPTDWRATWICGDYTPRKKARYPVDCFRKIFDCGQTGQGRLYITACGLYEAWLNGTRVGENRFTPGFTNYAKRLHYQSYDVSALLRPGENELVVLLADGWYRGAIGAMGVTCAYGKQTKLLAQLEAGGMIAVTDDTWNWSNDGPLRFADMKDGERVDLRLSPAFRGRARRTACAVVPSAADNVPVTEHERFTPELLQTPSGKTLLDFGQNIAGYVELSVNARQGQRIYMQFAEHLDAAGELDMASIQCKAGTPDATPKQEIELLCVDGRNDYKTRFAVFGFRYAAVQTEVTLTARNVTAIALYSDMEPTGEFSCSNELINRFVQNTLWSMKGNFLDVPTDCPTRERAPWTGDAQIFCRTGTYFMDTAAFYRKWLRDVRDRQRGDGMVPCHVPDVHNNEYIPHVNMISRMDGCCGWADAAVLMPWQMYQMYADIRFLRECYSSMRAHTLFQIGRTNRTGLFGKPFKGKNRKYISNVGQAFGEWLEPQEVYKQSVVQDFLAPHPEEATAYLAYVCGIMAQVASLLGEERDKALYEQYHTGCKRAYAEHFAPADTDRQSKLVRPLAFDLLDGEPKQRAEERLLSSIKKRGYRIGTGFLSTPLILPLLSRLGHTDIAYRMMENEEAPGWLYEAKAGATTVWETWEGIRSQNHYSPGSVCEWLFETVAGIRVSGENRFDIAPIPGGTLTWAQASYLSAFGLVSCRWERRGGMTDYTVILPANTTARVTLPGGAVKEIDTGIHKFSEESTK